MNDAPDHAIHFDGVRSELGQPVPFEVRWTQESRQWQVRVAHLTVPGSPEGLREFAENALLDPEDGLESPTARFASNGGTELSAEFTFHGAAGPVEISALAVFDFARGFHAISKFDEPLYGADGTTGPYLQFYGEGIDRAGFVGQARELLAALDAHPDAIATYGTPTLRAEFTRPATREYEDVPKLRLSTTADQWWLRMTNPSIAKPLPADTVRKFAAVLRSAGELTLLAELGYRMVATVADSRLSVRVSSPGEDGTEYAIDADFGEIDHAALSDLP